MEMKIKTSTIIRTALLVIAMVNQILSTMGKPILPIDDAQIEVLITTGFSIIMAIMTWWKNNSFTQEAIRGDKEMISLKEMKKEARRG